MLAMNFRGPFRVRADRNMPYPEIEHPEDAIVKVLRSCICGSDLHLYHGLVPDTRTGSTFGHEFIGEIVETGSAVTNVKVGDRVMVPFNIACGKCAFCRQELYGNCHESNPEATAVGGIFGYSHTAGGYHGGQAEYVRVPYADYGPRKVPDSLTDEQVLFLTDIFPTGWSAIDWAELKGGETVAVFGCGPVGIMAMKSAWLRGAGRVIGIDIEGYRLDMAKKSANVETINAKEVDVVEAIRSMTKGYGADVCVDAVGMEANHSMWTSVKNLVQGEAGTMKVLERCFDAVRRGGTVTVVGVYGTPFDNFPLHQWFDKGIKLRGGQALVHNYIDHLLELVQTGKVTLDDIITHTVKLEDAPKMYDIFNKKQDNCMKVVLKP